MKAPKTTVLTLAEKCKNILASNWQATLNTIKADATGSKEEIYSSKVKYFVQKGRPYIWVPEIALHNV
nr:L-ectoine synthase [Tanacetum cinerariifolium]